MPLGDLYFRMCNSQTVLLFEKKCIFIDRFTIGTIPLELFKREVEWIIVDNSSNLEIYLK